MNIALKAWERVDAWRSGEGREGLSRLARLGARLTSLALIALIAWFLADTILTLTAPSERPQSTPRVASTPDLDESTLAEAGGLFGQWDETGNAMETSDSNDLEETNLPLKLIGVFVSVVAQQSSAIIASGSGEGKQYLVGDRIPGNAVLESVEASSVMLRRGARLERLSFPQSESEQAFKIQPSGTGSVSNGAMRQGNPTGLAGELAATSAASSLSAASLGEKIEEYRQMATENPQGALDQLGLAPVSASEVMGYRVGDLPDNPWVRQTGLQDGDIVLSVNGRRIGDPDLDRLEIDNFFAEGQVRLEIQRGERRFFVNAKLSP